MSPGDASDLSRLLVVGTSCSGKTRFACRAARALGAPHVELDALYWKPDWVERDREEFRGLVAKAVAADRWVVDGNYSVVRDLVWTRGTAIAWLDYPFRTVFGRALRRTVRRGIRREELWSGNRESLLRAFFTTDSILWWVITSYRRRRREYRRLARGDDFPNLEFLVFGRPSEAEAFLSGLEGGDARGPSGKDRREGT
jgi:adenylate kinase family enzyme